MITFLNFDGSTVGALPTGFANTTTITGHPGNFEVGTSGSISSPNSLFDASGNTGGSALWTGLVVADEAIQFDQVVSLTGGVMNPLVRMSANGQTGYGASITWSTSSVNLLLIKAGGVISTLATVTIPTYASGTHVTIKLEIQGTTLRFKAWTAGTTEPTAWNGSTTDSTFAAAGSCGFSNGGGSADNVYFGPAGSLFSGGFIAAVLTNGAVTASSAQVSWTSSSQSGGTLAYQLMRSPHGANTFVAVSGATTSPATDSTVAISTSYDYRVTATDGVNAPVNSNVVTMTTPGVSCTISPFVAGSGQSIGLTTYDPSGNPTAIASIRDPNEVQTLTLKGLPSGGSFALSFGGQTTAGIPVTASIPTNYGLYTIPVTSGKAYAVAFSLGGHWDQGDSGTLVQIFDGGLLVETAVVDQTATGFYDWSFVDPTSVHATILMKNLGTYTPTSSTLEIYVTKNHPNQNGISTICDVVTLTDPSGNVTYYDDNSSYFSGNGGFGYGPLGTLPDGCYDNGGYISSDFTEGGYGFSATAATIQAALTALSTIGANGASVVDTGGLGTGPWAITFTGVNGGIAQNLITCSDPTVTIVRSFAGGQFATLTVTPPTGPAFTAPIKKWIYGVAEFANYDGTIQAKSAPYASWAQGLLAQSMPQNLYCPIAQGFTNFAGGWRGSPSAGYSGLAIESLTAGDVVGFYALGLPPATYAIYVTWVADTSLGLANNVPVVVTDATTGATLASTTIDQSVVPTDLVQAGFHWKLAATITTVTPTNSLAIDITNPGGHIAADTVLIVRTSPDLSQSVLPGSTVTFSAPAGLINTVAGIIPPAANLPILNYSGGSSFAAAPGQAGFPAFNATTTKTTKIGYNIEPDDYYMPGMIKSNLIEGMILPFNNVVTQDVNGYPTLLSASFSNGNSVRAASNDLHGQAKGMYACPSGVYTVMWDGPDMLSLDSNGATVTELTQYRNITGAAGNVRVFNMQSVVTYFSPKIVLDLKPASATPDANGHYAFSSKNFRVYPPNPTDLTGMTPWGLTSTPPTFHPNFIAMTNGIKSARFMDWFATNNNAITEITDFRQPGSLQGPTRTLSVPVASIQQYTGTPMFNPNDLVIFEITTTVPHGAVNGPALAVNLQGQTVHFSDGSTFTGYNGPSITGNVMVISPTVFQIQGNTSSNNGAITMTNVLTSGLVTGTIGSAGILQDAFDFCNQVQCAMWFNIPGSASNACGTAIGQYIAAHLNPSLTCYLEFFNEHWNSGFQSYRWCRSLTYQLTGTEAGDPTTGYTIRAGQLHTLIINAARAAGWTGTFKRVMGGQATNPGVCNNIIATASAHSISFDCMAIAPYINPQAVQGIEATLQPIYDQMTPYGNPATLIDQTGGQTMDLFENWIQNAGLAAQTVTPHRTELNTAGLTNVSIVFYEAGPGALVPATISNNSVNGFWRNHVCGRHPRMYHAMLRHFQQMNDMGVELMNIFYLMGGNFASGQGLTATPQDWSTFFGWNQQAGTGNAAIDTVNVATPERLDLSPKSQVGGSISYWNSLLSQPSGGLPGRIVPKMIGATGYRPFGASQSTRGGRRF